MAIAIRRAWWFRRTNAHPERTLAELLTVRRGRLLVRLRTRSHRYRVEQVELRAVQLGKGWRVQIGVARCSRSYNGTTKGAVARLEVRGVEEAWRDRRGAWCGETMAKRRTLHGCEEVMGVNGSGRRSRMMEVRVVTVEVIVLRVIERDTCH